MLDPITLISGGVGLLGSIGKMFGRGAANRQMRKLMARMPEYKENPLARQQLGLAQTMLNARMPGAASAERNIYGSQANAISNVERAGTDSAQALAAASGIQGQTNQAFQNLGVQEAGDYQRRYGNLAAAQQGVINEQDKVYQDKMNRFQMQTQLLGGINENRQNTMGDISNLGFGLAAFTALNPGMFGGGGQPNVAGIPMPQNFTNNNQFRKPTYNSQTGQFE